MAAEYKGKRVKKRPVSMAGLRTRLAVVTVGELRSNFKAIEAKLAKGVRVQITRRGEVVAEMLAPAVETAGMVDNPNRLPDFEARLKRIWGGATAELRYDCVDI
jgi:antitoxin (DNA-binding transcriptional repressor) of toxin-antitoxin stability system